MNTSNLFDICELAQYLSGKPEYKTLLSALQAVPFGYYGPLRLRAWMRKPSLNNLLGQAIEEFLKSRGEHEQE